MGDMLVSLWSIMANFGFETDELARKVSNIIAKDENGDEKYDSQTITNYENHICWYPSVCRIRIRCSH